MTEKKRFRSSPTDDYNFADVLDNGKWIGSCHVDCADDFCKKMNELNDTNNQLREEIKDFQTLLADKENELLKPIIRQIEEAYNNERTTLGKNVLKQLLESLE